MGHTSDPFYPETLSKRKTYCLHESPTFPLEEIKDWPDAVPGAHAGADALGWFRLLAASGRPTPPHWLEHSDGGERADTHHFHPCEKSAGWLFRHRRPPTNFASGIAPARRFVGYCCKSPGTSGGDVMLAVVNPPTHSTSPGFSAPDSSSAQPADF